MDHTTSSARKGFSGFVLLLVATAIAGLIGYVITWLVPREIGFASYALYAVYWSFLFLVVGSLSGIQQEITRAQRAAAEYALVVVDRVNDPRANLWRFTAVAAAGVFVLLTATSPLWATAAFGRDGWSFVLPLACGASFYVVVAAVGGTLYGASRWGLLFLLISIEAVLRILAIGVVLLVGGDTVALAWAVSIPFPLTLAILWRGIRRAARGRVALDVSYGRLIWNVARTIAAAASLGLMVSGFPFILGLVSGGANAESLGLLILTITLTRAPLIVVVMALQSYLVVFFRDRVSALLRSILLIGAVIGSIALLLALGLGLIGPELFGLLFPGDPTPGSTLLIILVLSSALVGLLCVTGTALLATGRHGYYSAGWATAAAVSVVILLTPVPLNERTIVALLAGPIAGLIVHAVGVIVAQKVLALTNSRSS